MSRIEAIFAFSFAAALLADASGLWTELGLAQSGLVAEEILAIAATEKAAEIATPLFFEKHVRPLLKAHCWQCHGEEDTLEAGLDLRFVRLIRKGGESGPALVSGPPEASLIWKRIAADEMPPGKKKLSRQERTILREWLTQGAKAERAEPEAVPAESPWTDEERSHWAYQPVRRVPVPTVSRPELIASPIDAFLLRQLDAGQDGTAFAFSPPAERLVLLRRVHFDLLGLPPTPELVERFLSDTSPDAWDRLVDELLDSPRYGERWGRHWLDVAGYADSEGYTEEDPVRPWSFKYRDYVLSAFNDDKPFDRFVIEQFAGDELLAPPYQNLSREQSELLAATGFLRMGPDGTGGSVDQNVARNEVVAETIKIASTSLLGLSVGCAQCHSHRYDPISQIDYYRFRALFEPAYDWKNWKPPAQRLLNLWSTTDHERAAAVDREVAKLEGGRVKEFDVLVAEVYERELAKLDDELREAARHARSTKPDMYSAFQKQLLKDYPSLEVNHGTISLYDGARTIEITNRYDKLKGEARANRPKDDFVACLTEPPGHLPTTTVFYRGDMNQPKQPVTPAELSVIGSSPFEISIDDPNLPTSGRRLAYARHLTNGRHPLLARVFVNRVWMHHFGRGLVATPADFGFLGERPSHPELLDWLADEFVRGGWQIKRIHRLLVTSTAYRQSSKRSDALQLVDPDNRLLARMTVRRLEAEAIRDAILLVSGQLSDKMHGPAISVLPDADGQNIVGRGERDGNGILIGKQDGLGEDEFRRSVYVQVRRSMPLGMLEPFDLAGMAPNCERRTFSTVAPQSLLMMNNDFLLKQSEAIARRIEESSSAEPAARIQLAWQLAYGRVTSDKEIVRATEFLAAQQAYFDAALAKLSDAERAAQTPPSTRALALLCQTLLCSNAFLYVD